MSPASTQADTGTVEGVRADGAPSGSTDARHPSAGGASRARRRVELPRARSNVWRIGQGALLVAFGALLIGLRTRPELTLDLLWNGLVPGLPALLLIHPSLWRNVCPLATLNTLASRFGTRRRPPPAWSGTTAWFGLALLAVAIPARRVSFNSAPDAVGAAAAIAALAAVASGLAFGWKAGFCNALCPMLPIERLYGQAPLAPVPNGRCDSCTLCTRRGCLDLAGPRSIPQVLGPSRSSAAWLRTPFGLFACAFPGMIVGYALLGSGATRDGSATSLLALGVAFAGASALLSAATVRVLRLDWQTALTSLAALSAALFYGLLADDVAHAWGGSGATAWTIRGLGWALVIVWLVRGRQAARPRRS